MVAYRASGSILMAQKDFNGGLGSGNVQVDFDTPFAVAPGVEYRYGVRTNRYTATLPPPAVPASAFPYSNGLALSASGGSFDLAPSGVLFPSTLSGALYFVSPVIDINPTNRVSILVNGLRRLGARVKPLRPVIVHNKPQAVAAQEPVRYRFSSFTRKWRITMFTERVDSTSLARVQAGVEADANGLPYDPTATTVQFAFLTSRLDKPDPGDWKTGSWDVTRIGTYVAQCNVGTGGAVALSPGNYYTWIKITDPVAGEIPIEQIARLIVT
jgi:hypothetical protein